MEQRMKLQHTFCVEYEAVASLRHAYLGSFFLEIKDINAYPANVENRVSS
jgi:hypothetical protein